MYKIAVCEDEQSVLDTNAALAKAALREIHIEGSVSVFSCADDLLAAFEDDSRAFDLLFLDILMDGMNGIELAKKLRSRGVEAAVAFITSSEEFLRDGYCVQPVNYLFKPAEYKNVLDVIQTARRSGATQTVVFRSGQNMFVLEASQIIYVEVYDHKLHIHMTSGERVVSGTLSAAMETLPGKLFAQCHKSYLVNLSYVIAATHCDVSLPGEQSVPIGRNYYDDFMKSLVKYLS